MTVVRIPLHTGGVVSATLTEHDGDAEIELVVPGADGLHCATRWPAERLDTVIEALNTLRGQLQPLPEVTT